MNGIGLAGLWFIFLGCLCLFISTKVQNLEPEPFRPYEQWSDHLKVCTQGQFWKFYGYCIQEFSGQPHGPELEKFELEWRRIGNIKKGLAE